MLKYLYAILSILFAVCGQVFIKYASLQQVFQKKWLFYILLSVTFYGLAFILQSIALKYFPLSKYSASTAIIILIIVFSCGVLFFNETIHIKQYIGLTLGVISIYLITS